MNMIARSPAQLGVTQHGVAEQLYARGYRALSKGDAITAERCFGVLVVLEAREERGWVGLGAAQEQQGRLGHAAAAYRLGTGFVPGSVWLRLGLGRALLRRGRLREAERAFDEAESLTSDAALLKLIEQEREET